MSASYAPILWNRQKKIYDKVLWSFVVVYLTMFTVANLLIYPEITAETLIIRSTSTLAIILLHVILLIGPLARLNRVFLPLLYNRRHLGVTMFILGAIHGGYSIFQFHAFGNTNPILSLFQSNTHYESITKFPFEVFGFFALLILFLMAITSHDFWLHNLGARVWKTLHMFVYLAYALIIAHVLLGVIQYETSPVFVGLLGVGMFSIITLHIMASRQEMKKEKIQTSGVNDGYVKVCEIHDIPDNRAKIYCDEKERIAIFRYGNKLSAISNVCQHQNGPLGEGRIIDGCITCPWHGYQYLPHNGSSPAPFTEKVPTYDVKLDGESVWVNPTPYPNGSERAPAIIPNEILSKLSDEKRR